MRIKGCRITATGATRWALPAAVSRSYISLIAGFQHTAVIAAMDVTSRGPHRPPRSRSHPCSARNPSFPFAWTAGRPPLTAVPATILSVMSLRSRSRG